ncbi:MAG: hypothetical protein NVS2B16_21980 [Chloroflexota bacterium]
MSLECTCHHVMTKQGEIDVYKGTTDPSPAMGGVSQCARFGRLSNVEWQGDALEIDGARG